VGEHWPLVPRQGRLRLRGPPNYTGYCQRLVTADLDQAQRILDADQQARVVNRADAQLARDVPVIPLYQQPVWAAVRSGVRGYVVFPTVLDALHGAENWWLER
jgi:peptide/nickel transport system substrate-binding protein